MIGSYDPNTDFNDKHVVEVVIQCWEFKRAFTVEVESNLRGLDVVEYALEKVDAEFYESEGEHYEIKLTDEKGNSLLISDDDNEGEDWLKKYLVSYKILDFKC